MNSPNAQLTDTHINMYRAIRVAHDLSHLRLRDVADSSANWIVAEIVPAESSGRLHVFGAHINVDTGETVKDQEQPEVRSIVEGKWRIVQKLATAGFRKGPFQSYEWTQAQKHWTRDISIDQLFPVFFDHCGGHIICVHNPKVSGAEQFGSVTLIPDEWLNHIKPALTFVSRNRSKLRDLATAYLDANASVEANPFVSIALVQELIAAELPTETLARAFLPRMRGHTQAIVTCLFARRQGLKEMSGPLADCVQHAASPADIVGMMTGLRSHTWIGFDQFRGDARKPNSDTLKGVADQVKARYQSIKDDSSATPALGAILESMGMGTDASNSTGK
jgi:hypothetical protein